MNKPCLVIGCGSHCYSVISILESIDGCEIAGLIDTQSEFDKSEVKSGYSVVGNLELIVRSLDSYRAYSFAIAIGDNLERANIYRKLKSLGLDTPNFISSRAFVDRTVKIGDGNVVAHHTVLNSEVNIGSNNLINTSSVIEHNSEIGDHNHIGPKSIMCGNTKIGDSCMLGGGAIMIPKTTLTSFCTLGAGAVVTKPIEHEHAIFIGVPAKEK